MKNEIKKIKLVTNILCYGPEPKPNEEVEQRLTLDKMGRVWFYSYNFGHGFHGFELKSSSRKSVDKEKVNLFFNHLQQYFERERKDCFLTDVGAWTLHITYEDGKVAQYTGSIGQENKVDGMDLSNELRLLMQNKDLFAFDGNC